MRSLGGGLLAWAALAFAQGTEYPAVKYRSNYLASYYLSHSPTTVPWWPAWSPDGRWIAVSMHGSIWKIDWRTGEAWELTHARKLHSSPAWSPDGKWIVYTADDDWRSIQLEAVNVETGETRALTHDDQVYSDPAFSPKGERLAYVSTKGTGDFHLFTRAIRGGDWSGPETQLSREHGFGRGRQYFSEQDLHIEPAWLRNGSELLVVSNRGVALGSGHLWRIPVDGTDAMTRAKPILTEQSLFRTRPDVSPDGKRVLYSSTAGAADQFNHLYVLPVEGGQPYKLTFGDFDDFHPRWSPDGESIAYISNEAGLPELYVLEVNGGGKRKLEIAQRHWKQAMATLRVTVADEAGTPVEARISGSASDGKLYAPADSYVFNARLATGLERIFYTRGSYRVEAPPGMLAIEATKGFEYEPARAEVDLAAGETRELRLTLRRKSDAAARGWYNGSTHVHMNYGGTIHNTPELLMLMARAQGMNIVSGLVANKDNRILDWQYFRKGGGEHPASNLAARSLLLFGEENRPPFWGHTFYIGLRDHLISPFMTGYEGTALDSLYPSNTDLFQKARAQGAATGYVHAFGGDGDPLEGGLGGAKAFPVDVALGTVDALEWSAASRGSLIPLFHSWNNDFHIAPVGGEDALANMQDHRPVGIIRTFAWLGGEFSADAWVRALKQGHTYLSSGPVVEFRVNGKIPGDEVRLPAAGGVVTIEGEVSTLTPLRKAVIYRAGKIWKQVGAKFSEQVPVDASTWFSLIVEADELPPAAPSMYAQAVTNCVRVYVGDGKIRLRESAQYFLVWIERLRKLTQASSLWRNDAERAHVHRQFDEAVRVYESRMAEAK